jgi:aspartate kinase
MFDVLAQQGINIEMISTSEIKISVIVDLTKGESAIKAVHAAFLE